MNLINSLTVDMSVSPVRTISYRSRYVSISFSTCRGREGGRERE